MRDSTDKSTPYADIVLITGFNFLNLSSELWGSKTDRKGFHLHPFSFLKEFLFNTKKESSNWNKNALKLNYGYQNKRKLTLIMANIYWEPATHSSLWNSKYSDWTLHSRGHNFTGEDKQTANWRTIITADSVFLILAPNASIQGLSPARPLQWAPSFINLLVKPLPTLVPNLDAHWNHLRSDQNSNAWVSLPGNLLFRCAEWALALLKFSRQLNTQSS